MEPYEKLRMGAKKKVYHIARNLCNTSVFTENIYVHRDLYIWGVYSWLRARQH